MEVPLFYNLASTRLLFPYSLIFLHLISHLFVPPHLSVGIFRWVQCKISTLHSATYVVLYFVKNWKFQQHDWCMIRGWILHNVKREIRKERSSRELSESSSKCNHPKYLSYAQNPTFVCPYHSPFERKEKSSGTKKVVVSTITEKADIVP